MLPKIEEAEKKTCSQVRKRRRKVATIGGEKVVSNLFENEKAVTPLLKFLKTTGIGEREGTKEKQLEWVRKHD